MQYTRQEIQERITIDSMKPEFSDAHCHLNLFPDPSKTIMEAVSAGVALMVTAGGSSKDNAEVLKLASGPNVFGVVGISPDFAAIEAANVAGLEAIIKSNHNIVGIGEIGLDYKVARTSADADVQKEVFISQLMIANRFGLPVVIHSRGALDDTLEILREECKTRAMLHFFGGDVEQARVAESRNYLVSIPAQESKKHSRIMKETRLSSIVLESDSPAACKSPIDVVQWTGKLAALKDISVAEAASATTENLRAFFFI